MAVDMTKAAVSRGEIIRKDGKLQEVKRGKGSRTDDVLMGTSPDFAVLGNTVDPEYGVPYKYIGKSLLKRYNKTYNYGDPISDRTQEINDRNMNDYVENLLRRQEMANQMQGNGQQDYQDKGNTVYKQATGGVVPRYWGGGRDLGFFMRPGARIFGQGLRGLGALGGGAGLLGLGALGLRYLGEGTGWWNPRNKYLNAQDRVVTSRVPGMKDQSNDGWKRALTYAGGALAGLGTYKMGKRMVDRFYNDWAEKMTKEGVRYLDPFQIQELNRTGATDVPKTPGLYVRKYARNSPNQLSNQKFYQYLYGDQTPRQQLNEADIPRTIPKFATPEVRQRSEWAAENYPIPLNSEDTTKQYLLDNPKILRQFANFEKKELKRRENLKDVNELNQPFWQHTPEAWSDEYKVTDVPAALNTELMSRTSGDFPSLSQNVTPANIQIDLNHPVPTHPPFSFSSLNTGGRVQRWETGGRTPRFPNMVRGYEDGGEEAGIDYAGYLAQAAPYLKKYGPAALEAIMGLKGNRDPGTPATDMLMARPPVPMEATANPYAAEAMRMIERSTPNNRGIQAIADESLAASLNAASHSQDVATRDAMVNQALQNNANAMMRGEATMAEEIAKHGQAGANIMGGLGENLAKRIDEAAQTYVRLLEQHNEAAAQDYIAEVAHQLEQQGVGRQGLLGAIESILAGKADVKDAANTNTNTNTNTNVLPAKRGGGRVLRNQRIKRMGSKYFD